MDRRRRRESCIILCSTHYIPLPLLRFYTTPVYASQNFSILAPTSQTSLRSPPAGPSPWRPSAPPMGLRSCAVAIRPDAVEVDVRSVQTADRLHLGTRSTPAIHCWESCSLSMTFHSSIRLEPDSVPADMAWCSRQPLEARDDVRSSSRSHVEQSLESGRRR